MPHTDRDKKNAPWTLDTLREESSLVSRRPLSLDKHLPELKAGSLAPATVEELLTEDFHERLRPGVLTEPGKKWLVERKGQRVALVVAQCPQREAHWQIADGCQTNKYMQCLIDTMKADVLLLDHSFHCIKLYKSSKGFHCCCDFGELPAGTTDKQLAAERRKASCLGLIAATVQKYGLKITSASLLGTFVSRDFVDDEQPAAKLSNILGPDVPVKAFIHTSPLFLLTQNKLSDEERSWQLLRLIQHIASPFHLEDAKWSAQQTYDDFIALPRITGLRFVPKVYDAEAPRSIPVLTKEQGEEKKKAAKEKKRKAENESNSTPESKEKKKAARKRYRSTPAGKAQNRERVRKYVSTPEGKEKRRLSKRLRRQAKKSTPEESKLNSS